MVSSCNILQHKYQSEMLRDVRAGGKKVKVSLVASVQSFMRWNKLLPCNWH